MVLVLCCDGCCVGSVLAAHQLYASSIHVHKLRLQIWHNMKQVLEAVKEEVRAEKSPGSPCKVLIPILNSLTEQSQHTSFTIVRVDRVISLSRPGRSGSAMFPLLPGIPAPRRVPHRRTRTRNGDCLFISRQRRGLDRTVWKHDPRRYGGRGNEGRMS